MVGLARGGGEGGGGAICVFFFFSSYMLACCVCVCTCSETLDLLVFSFSLASVPRRPDFSVISSAALNSLGVSARGGITCTGSFASSFFSAGFLFASIFLHNIQQPQHQQHISAPNTDTTEAKCQRTVHNVKTRHLENY